MTSVKKHWRIALLVLIPVLVGSGYLVHLFLTPDGILPEARELSGTNWEFDQYREYLVKVADKKGAVYAFEVLRQTVFAPEVYVHGLGHYVGFKLYDQMGLEGLRFCTEEFKNACSHAILTQGFVSQGFGILDDIANICASSDGGWLFYTTCFHGVGHGLMAYLDYDYEASIGKCKEIYSLVQGSHPYATTANVWYECVGGATMELMVGTHDIVRREEAKKVYAPLSDVYMPCTASYVDEEVRWMCYAYLANRFLEEVGATRGAPLAELYPAALNYCAEIPGGDRESIEGCYMGFGSNFVHFASKEDKNFTLMNDSELRSIHEWCGFIEDEEGRKVCMTTALDAIFWDGTSASDTSLRFCDFAPEPGLTEHCFNVLGAMARRAFSDREELQSFCARVPEANQPFCYTE